MDEGQKLGKGGNELIQRHKALKQRQQDEVVRQCCGDTRSALEVFCLYEADGEYFDISDPAHIVRDGFAIGKEALEAPGYYVGEGCIGCKLCYSVCPQKCIDITKKPVVIDQHHCLHCGRCAEICPKQVIEKRA